MFRSKPWFSQTVYVLLYVHTRLYEISTIQTLGSRNGMRLIFSYNKKTPAVVVTKIRKVLYFCLDKNVCKMQEQAGQTT